MEELQDAFENKWVSSKSPDGKPKLEIPKRAFLVEKGRALYQRVEDRNKDQSSLEGMPAKRFGTGRAWDGSCSVKSIFHRNTQYSQENGYQSGRGTQNRIDPSGFFL